MTDGRIDGNFIPEVREFHSSHPGWERPTYLSDRDESAAAAAVVHSDALGHGDSLVDAS